MGRTGTARDTIRLVLATLLAASALPAAALYKVVGTDGRITYTDRPPADTSSKVMPLGREAVVDVLPAPDLLPYELRQVSAKYPVTLYVVADCSPCDAARQHLQQRGIPFAERRVGSEDDAVALEQLLGARTVPALTVGSQVLRGFSSADWSAYLDAAGYPRESRLPRGWQPPAATTIVERIPARPAAPPAAEPAATAPPAEPTPRQTSGLRF